VNRVPGVQGCKISTLQLLVHQESTLIA
jgi:hypothetical protein